MDFVIEALLCLSSKEGQTLCSSKTGSQWTWDRRTDLGDFHHSRSLGQTAEASDTGREINKKKKTICH